VYVLAFHYKSRLKSNCRNALPVHPNQTARIYDYLTDEGNGDKDEDKKDEDISQLSG
jgi:hypothetical protein